MSIANISDGEVGSSVRGKLNSLIDISNYTVVVGGNGTAAQNHTNLQAAITAASSGDMILVREGGYGVDSDTLNGKDGVSLIGDGSNQTIINGSLNLNGLSSLKGLYIQGINSSADNTVFEDCTISRNAGTGDIKLTASDSTLSFNNCEFVFDVSEPAISLSNCNADFFNCETWGIKTLATGASVLNMNGCRGGVFTGGTYTLRFEDTTVATMEDTTIYMLDSAGDIAEGGDYRQMQVRDNSKLKATRVRYDNIVKVYNDGQATLKDYVSKWSGRLDASSDATSNAFIKATNFYIHMDNGFDDGSHNIEVTLGNTLPTFYLDNGVIEYMGDQGEYPMVGNASAGGGKQRWNRVTLIDHGSALNAASSDDFPNGYAYDYLAVYGNDDAIYTNCDFYWGAIHDPNPNVPANSQGMIQIKVDSDDFVKCHINNCRVSILEKTERAAFLVTEQNKTLGVQDDVIINAQITNCPLASSDNSTRDAIEQRLKLRSKFAQKNQIFTDEGFISNLEIDTISKVTKAPRVTAQSSANATVDLRNNISTTDLNAIINDGEILLGTGTQGSFRKNLNLSLPKRFTKGQGTINIKTADATYTSGYIQAVSDEPLTYLRVENAHILVEDGTTGKYFVYQLSNAAPASADTIAVNANTPVISDISATDYHILYEANTGNQTLGYNCHASPNNYLVLDSGSDRIQTPMYVEFLVKLNANFTGNQDGSIYKVTYSNLYRGSSTAPQVSISVDTISEGLSSAYKLTPSNITSDEYTNDDLRKRYGRISITGVNSNACLSFDFLQAYNVVDGYLINTDNDV